MADSLWTIPNWFIFLRLVTDNCAYIIKVKSYNLNYEQRQTNDAVDNFVVRFRQMVGSLLRQYDRNLYIQDIKLR